MHSHQYHMGINLSNSFAVQIFDFLCLLFRMPCDAVSEWYRVDQIKDLLYKRVSVIVGEKESATAKNCVSGILIAADPISHR